MYFITGLPLLAASIEVPVMTFCDVVSMFVLLCLCLSLASTGQHVGLLEPRAHATAVCWSAVCGCLHRVW